MEPPTPFQRKLEKRTHFNSAVICLGDSDAHHYSSSMSSKFMCNRGEQTDHTMSFSVNGAACWEEGKLQIEGELNAALTIAFRCLSAQSSQHDT